MGLFDNEAIEFYTSNVSGSGPGGFVLEEGTGDRGVFINCVANFQHGKISDIKIDIEIDEKTPTFQNWAKMEKAPRREGWGILGQ